MNGLLFPIFIVCVSLPRWFDSIDKIYCRLPIPISLSPDFFKPCKCQFHPLHNRFVCMLFFLLLVCSGSLGPCCHKIRKIFRFCRLCKYFRNWRRILSIQCFHSLPLLQHGVQASFPDIMFRPVFICQAHAVTAIHEQMKFAWNTILTTCLCVQDTVIHRNQFILQCMP